MVDSIDRKIIRFVQDDLPLVSRPYAYFAHQEGISEEEVCNRLQSLSERGIIRRFGAVVRHQKAGYKSNAMVVWMVDESLCDDAAEILGASDAVSHLYERKTFPDWKYNLFSMIHAKSDSELEHIIDNFAQALKNIAQDYKVLRSVREFKKTSMKYFTETDK